MATKPNPFRRIRLVFRHSSPLVKKLVLATLIVCTVTLLVLAIAIGNAKANTETLRQEAADYVQKNEELSEDIGELGTLKSFKDLATKLLGLVDPNTVIFSPEE